MTKVHEIIDFLKYLQGMKGKRKLSNVVSLDKSIILYFRIFLGSNDCYVILSENII